MTLIIDENPYLLMDDGSGRLAYFIKVKGIRKRFEADNDQQLLLAIAHSFRPKETDARHWGKGVPDCPLCL